MADAVCLTPKHSNAPSWCGIPGLWKGFGRQVGSAGGEVGKIGHVCLAVGVGGGGKSN